MRQILLSNKSVFEIEQRIQDELQAESMYRCLSVCMQQIGLLGFSKFFKKAIASLLFIFSSFWLIKKNISLIDSKEDFSGHSIYTMEIASS